MQAIGAAPRHMRERPGATPEKGVSAGLTIRQRLSARVPSLESPWRHPLPGPDVADDDLILDRDLFELIDQHLDPHPPLAGEREIDGTGETAFSRLRQRTADVLDTEFRRRPEAFDGKRCDRIAASPIARRSAAAAAAAKT